MPRRRAKKSLVFVADFLADFPDPLADAPGAATLDEHAEDRVGSGAESDVALRPRFVPRAAIGNLHQVPEGPFKIMIQVTGGA
jgi:hypothetical protein